MPLRGSTSQEQVNHQGIGNEGWPAPVETEKENHHTLVSQVDAQRMQLISPPPEPARNVKRKRGPPTPAKPSSSSAVVGRTLKSRGSRRSATPIPPYEPPPDIFTPPREVFLKLVQPKTVSKSSRRKGSVISCGKGKALRVDTTKRGTVQVKQELPDDLDLLAPMPPPSPTDDPLLLRGQPKPKPSILRIECHEVEETKRSASVQVQTEQEVIVLSDDLPPSSPDARDRSIEDSMMQLDDPQDADVIPVRLFDIDVGATGDGGWSDSDDEPAQENEEEGEGKYTGKWKMFKIRTKQDPPSSATRTRQELWGRPISPFPKMTTLDLLEEQLEEDEVRKMSVEPESHGSEQATGDMKGLNEETPFPNLENWSSNVQVIHESDEDEGAEDTDTEDEPSLVKITSVDPRAAARAVAILKRHDYDCYTKLVKKRRSSHSADDFAKETRRRSASDSGITKSVTRERRRSTMGVIGDKVIIPGSPIMTLPELLQEAEKEVVHEISSVLSARTSFAGRVEVRDAFKTPLVNKLRYRTEGPMALTPEHCLTGEREWTKDDWKLLDACFTDVRLDHGDPESGVLAPVDFVRLEDVISRFLDLMGGQSLADTFGKSWTRDNLLQRARALMKKQNSGNVAHPTTPATPLPFASPSMLYALSPAFEGTNPPPIMEVPDFTPLSRSQKSLSRPVLPMPVAEKVPSENFASADGSQIGVPPTLLAPRYSHLLEEATAFGKHDSTLILWHENKGTQNAEGIMFPIMPGVASADSHEVLRNEGQPSVPRIEMPRSLNKPATSTLGSRVKGSFTSYLPTLSYHPQSHHQPIRHGLPLPPPSVLEKSRGPISTPIRPPVPRDPHPKELVHLNPAPPPSHIPRAKVVPKRLVELVPILPPPSKEFKTGLVPRPRRSSGSSVKDLVRGFEQMDKIAVDEMELKRTGNINDPSWSKGHFSKPKWRP